MCGYLSPSTEARQVSGPQLQWARHPGNWQGDWKHWHHLAISPGHRVGRQESIRSSRHWRSESGSDRRFQVSPLCVPIVGFLRILPRGPGDQGTRGPGWLAPSKNQRPPPSGWLEFPLNTNSSVVCQGNAVVRGRHMGQGLSPLEPPHLASLPSRDQDRLCCGSCKAE